MLLPGCSCGCYNSAVVCSKVAEVLAKSKPSIVQARCTAARFNAEAAVSEDQVGADFAVSRPLCAVHLELVNLLRLGPELAAALFNLVGQVSGWAMLGHLLSFLLLVALVESRRLLLMKLLLFLWGPTAQLSLLMLYSMPLCPVLMLRVHIALLLSLLLLSLLLSLLLMFLPLLFLLLLLLSCCWLITVKQTACWHGSTGSFESV